MKKAYTFIIAIALLFTSIVLPVGEVSALTYNTSHNISNVGPEVIYTDTISTGPINYKIHKFTATRNGRAIIKVLQTYTGGPLQVELLDANFNVIPNGTNFSGINVLANQVFYLKVTNPPQAVAAAYTYMGHYIS